ncbi:MAG: hypothetical protein FWG11_01585 [Promicromonosporaceae bacterium]|nr:hypothetical protein [Promicromonosporaceae bacterium]
MNAIFAAILAATVAASPAMAPAASLTVAPGVTSPAVSSAAQQAAPLGATPLAVAPVSLALPDPAMDGHASLTVSRVLDGLPAPDDVTVGLYLLPHAAGGEPIDLTTRAGWNLAADLTLAEALTLPRTAIGAAPTVGGTALFSDLPLGLFLVTITYLDGEEAHEPFIVSVPRTNDAGNGWNYHVLVQPKATPPIWAHIGGIVWYDANRNGLFDEGEEVVPGVTVHVYVAPLDSAVDGAGRPRTVAPSSTSTLLPDPREVEGGATRVLTTVTDENGEWLLQYQPVIVKQVTYVIDGVTVHGSPVEFTIYGGDSHADPRSGVAAPIQLIAFDTVFLDAGVVREAPAATPTPSPTPTLRPTPPGLPVTGGTLAGLFIGLGAVGGGLAIKKLSDRRRDAEETTATVDSPER